MLPKMVTEVAEFEWNPVTRFFETRIYSTDTTTGKRQLIDFFATPPDVFIEAFAAQVIALNDFRPEPKGDVVSINEARKHG